MNDQATALAAQAAGQALQQSARAHKRAQAAARKATREAMQALDALKAEMAKHGIELVIETDTGKGAKVNEQ